MSANNDSADLEALFDSIASDFVPAPAPVAVATRACGCAQPFIDRHDMTTILQALFDSVSLETQVAQKAASSPTSPEAGASRCWKMAATAGSGFQPHRAYGAGLHDTLGQLGYDKLLEKTVSALPDAKDRLGLCGQPDRAGCMSRA
jgi:chemotaxis protein CheZ